MAARADQRQKLERLCRYISRPAISEKRLSLTPNGNVRYQLKTPYRDGTTHVIFEPLDFIARLAALVPKPRVNLSVSRRLCAKQPIPGARDAGQAGQGGQHARTADPEEPTSAERRAAMTWAQRLKRVFGIDIETCPACGGRCGSSPASRIPTSSIRSSHTWMRRWLSPKVRGGRRAGRHRKRVCLTDQSMTTSLTKLHHPLTRWGSARPVG